MEKLILSMLILASVSAKAVEADINPPSKNPTPHGMARAYMAQGRQLALDLPAIVSSAKNLQKKKVACERIARLALITKTLSQEESAVAAAAYALNYWTARNLALSLDLVTELERGFCINKTLQVPAALRLAQSVRSYQFLE